MGRRCAVGRGLDLGVGLGRGVGVNVAVGVGLDVAVGVSVGWRLTERKAASSRRTPKVAAATENIRVD